MCWLISFFFFSTFYSILSFYLFFFFFFFFWVSDRFGGKLKNAARGLFLPFFFFIIGGFRVVEEGGGGFRSLAKHLTSLVDCAWPSALDMVV
jgi:hypothetical protein